jgi:AcrR family transcriptional regulator
MTDEPAPRLPRGRHGLSRDEVEASQRVRMLTAMADAMMEKGYVRTSVADVIRRAGVSRETFYQQFSSKADCFRTAFDAAGEVLLGTVGEVAELVPADLHPPAGRDDAARVEQFERVFTAYLDALASHPAHARLFLVEVYAAGPEAISTRIALQRVIVDTLVALLGVTSEHGRFACEVLVAGISVLVTEPLARHDPEAVRDLRDPVVDLVRRALATGGDR